MRRLLCSGDKKLRQWENNLDFLPLGYCNSGIRSQLNRFSSTSRLIAALAKGGTCAEIALFEASRLFNSGSKPDACALVHLLRATTNLGWDPFGHQLHSYVLRYGYYSDANVSAALIRFYVGMQSLGDAHKLFVEIPQRNVVSWNTLISGYVHTGQFRKALSVLLQLEKSDVYADAFSFTSGLAACGHLGFLKPGKSIHSKVLKFGLVGDTVVANCLIDMYGKCECVEEAVRVFSEITDKDVISWNSVIAAAASNGKIEQALHFLHFMPNPDTISYNGLINGIAQMGRMEDAIQILSIMPNPNSSSWNSIITGFVNRNQVPAALDMFSKMHSRNVEMNEFTFSVILNGIACLSALTWGVVIQCCTIKHGLDASVVVGSALIDMHSKCGQVKNAESIFKSLSSRNLVSWNALICGYARSGDSARVIQLFELLKTEGHTKPDGITFLNLFFACSHNQIPLEVATQYFKSMISDYGIAPTVEHCCSMIRLMGKKGELWRAERMIHELGFQTSGLVWRALLGACEINRDLQIAEVAAVNLMKLEGNEDYVYVIMSNLYASYRRWEDVSVIRGLMRRKRVRKDAGSSWIEVENFVLYAAATGIK
ncbi:putative pentatricopeptide repeat-containing protein At5g47460 [Prosopis cineraria]|uniref:putative pentatricopeptide repeat-containing protein At5g47460 n=1 Tax=Prosopis cineraria TaxID=364024 RepID=UPI00241070AC|nr:putative pentatricopeptide repeat-containing protein At5g47460 [Prosopis cineraria]